MHPEVKRATNVVHTGQCSRNQSKLGGAAGFAVGREEVRLTLEANGSSELVLPRAMSEDRLQR